MTGLTDTANGQTKPMSLRAYARRRGTSAPSVLRAIGRGRLKASLVFIDGTAQIADPDLADREWLANTDLSKAPGYVKERDAGQLAVVGGVTVSVTPPVTPSVTPPGADADISLAEAARREKVWRAAMAELEYRERAAELMEAKDADARWNDVCVRVRTKLLGVPGKVKGRRSELTLEQLATIDAEIREALEDLATGSCLHQ